MDYATSKSEILTALEQWSYQAPFPPSVPCVKDGKICNPILVVTDNDGEIAKASPERIEGRPIHPHDSVCFVLYMCSECGEVQTLWNQA